MHLGHELRETDEELRLFDRADHAARAFPQPERLRQLARELHFAGEEDALPRHEDVVEHDEALRHGMVRTRRIVERVQLGRREVSVDDGNALAVHRN